MKNLQFNPYQCGVGRGWGGEGQGRLDLKILNPSQLHPPPCGAGLKSCPIPVLPPLRGRENLRGVKRGEADQARQGKIAIPSRERAKTHYL